MIGHSCSLVAASLLNIIGESPHLWPKIVIHRIPYIILYVIIHVFKKIRFIWCQQKHNWHKILNVELCTSESYVMMFFSFLKSRKQIHVTWLGTSCLNVWSTSFAVRLNTLALIWNKFKHSSHPTNSFKFLWWICAVNVYTYCYGANILHTTGSRCGL